jgi:hypothetical protein
MVILKFGENLSIDNSFISPESIKADSEIHDRFLKFAKDLKKIAPKADDFLYFTAVMMHAAERALIDDEGNVRKDANGNPITAEWEVDKNGSWKWKCSDLSIKPYKNANLDIFPESELKKAYKKWIGKPLCKDHQSSSVDGMRGLIVDTYWDDKHKRIIALCALDKVSYPELARHVKTGVASDVSMGVGVGASICFECGNVATCESEYCNHVRTRNSYGEINTDLNPIELSIVMTGADRKAKVLEVLAALDTMNSKISENEIEINAQELLSQYKKLSFRVEELEKEILNARNDNNFALKRIAGLNSKESESYLDLIKHKLSNLENTLTSIYKNTQNSTEDLMGKNIKQGYWQGTEEPKPKQRQYEAEEADSIRNTQDSHMKGELSDLSPAAGTEIPKQDLDVKKQLARASVEERRAIRAEAVERAKKSLDKKKAYILGTEEPKKYPVDPLAEKARKEDKQLQNPNTTGVYPEDAKLKEKLCRASLKARLVTSASASDNKWEVFDKSNDKMIFAASFKELAGDKKALYKPLYEKSFGRHLMSTIKSVGLDKANELFKSAQAAPAPATEPVEPTPAPEPVMEEPVAPEGGELAEPPPGDIETEGTPEGDTTAALNSVVEGLKGLSDVLDNALPSMEEAVEGMEGEREEFGTEVEQPEVAVEEALGELASPSAEPTVASLNKVRMVLNAGLRKSFKNSIKTLATCKEEIDLLKDAAANKAANPSILEKLAEEATKDAKKAIKDAEVLKMAFVKYAKSVYAIEKRAALEKKMKKEASLKKESQFDSFEEEDVEVMPVPSDEDEIDTTEVEPDEALPEPLEASLKQLDKEFNMKTAEGRKASRHKLAASVGSKLQFSDMLQKAHPKGGTKLEGISDTKEAHVEDIKEVSSKMQEVVSHEPKVKKAAEKLDKLIRAGRVDASKLDALVKKGLDKDVANYWKKYFGQVDGGSEFAAALLKDYSESMSKEKKAELEENTKAKIIRSFDLAYQMAKVGLCNDNQAAIKKEAEKILGYDDNAYASVKRIVDHHAKMNKQASANSVQVGVAFDSNNSSNEDVGSDLYSDLVRVFSDR